MLGRMPRVFSAAEVCALLDISRRKLNRMIREGSVIVVSGTKPLRILDPRWTTLAGLTYASIDDAPVFRSAEVAVMLQLSARRVRQMADKGEIPFTWIGKHRRYSLTAIRQVQDDRERGLQGRRSSGVRPWLVEWGQQQLGMSPVAI